MRDGYTRIVSFRAVALQLPMARPARRLNITLDPEHAARLAALAERTHVQEGTLARSLLSMAIEEADPEARSVTALLDGVSGAYERAQLGLERGRAGETVGYEEERDEEPVSIPLR
jgi:hypothetical protein